MAPRSVAHPLSGDFPPTLETIHYQCSSRCANRNLPHPPTITPQDSLSCVLRRAKLVNWFRATTDSSFSCTCVPSTAYCTISGATGGWPVRRRRAQTRTNRQLRPASQPGRGLLYGSSSCEKLG